MMVVGSPTFFIIQSGFYHFCQSFGRKEARIFTGICLSRAREVEKAILQVARDRQSKTTRNNSKNGKKCAQGWRDKGFSTFLFHIWWCGDEIVPRKLEQKRLIKSCFMPKKAFFEKHKNWGKGKRERGGPYM
jgi:hypothetical protein